MMKERESIFPHLLFHLTLRTTVIERISPNVEGKTQKLSDYLCSCESGVQAHGVSERRCLLPLQVTLCWMFPSWGQADQCGVRSMLYKLLHRRSVRKHWTDETDTINFTKMSLRANIQLEEKTKNYIHTNYKDPFSCYFIDIDILF